MVLDNARCSSPRVYDVPRFSQVIWSTLTPLSSRMTWTFLPVGDWSSWSTGWSLSWSTCEHRTRSNLLSQVSYYVVVRWTQRVNLTIYTTILSIRLRALSEMSYPSGTRMWSGIWTFLLNRLIFLCFPLTFSRIYVLQLWAFLSETFKSFCGSV